MAKINEVPATKKFGSHRFKRARKTPYRLKSEAQKAQKRHAGRHTRLEKRANGYMVWIGGKKKVAAKRNPDSNVRVGSYTPKSASGKALILLIRRGHSHGVAAETVRPRRAAIRRWAASGLSNSQIVDKLEVAIGTSGKAAKKRKIARNPCGCGCGGSGGCPTRRNPSKAKAKTKAKRKPTRRAAPKADAVAARELELFAVNDGGLYRRSRQPIEANLRRKRLAGTYDKVKAVKLWMYFADEAAREYNVQHGSGTRSMAIFDKPTRLAMAKSVAADFHSEVMLTRPKKKASKKRR